jgi:ferric-dicitrate binding protein FerR (iron transport regulator)
MTDQEFQRLLQGYKIQTLTPEELNQFLDAAADPRFENIIAEDFSRSAPTMRSLAVTDREKQDEVWNSILSGTMNDSKAGAKFRIHTLGRWMAAAVILLVVATTAYFWLRPESPAAINPVATSRSTADIEPGKEGAVLTLSDGTKVVLDSLGNGVVATQNGVKVLLRNGQLAYHVAGNATVTASYNTMTTPKGRQFSLVLPDGSKVWLNAASSITYPTFFSGSQRRVNITGEAYFEIVKDEKKPFHVSINNDAEVQVLGTQFNINSYENEGSIFTTLLEGSVRIVQGDQLAVLKPGQQAEVSTETAAHEKHNTQKIKVRSDVNLNKVMAWKNGVFDFQDATLEEVMRQLERWYDIEVVYEKDTPKIEFIGKMGRDLSLSNVLRGLEMSKVRFRLEDGRKLVVMP